MGYRRKFFIKYTGRWIPLVIQNSDKYDNNIIKEILEIEEYTPKDFEIKEKDTIIDIGAHIGIFSIYAAKISEKGRIYAYEPHPKNFKLLKENLKLNNINNVKVFKLGVCNKKGIFKLFTSKKNKGIHTLYKELDDSILIKCITLNEIFELNRIKYCDFLKLDCEGAEYGILSNTLRGYFDKIEKIVLECHNNLHKNRRYKIIKLLSERGFQIRTDYYKKFTEIIYAQNRNIKNNFFSKKYLKLRNYFQVYLVDKSKVYKNFFVLYFNVLYFNIDKLLGGTGLFLKKHHSKLYFKLKKLKNKFKVKELENDKKPKSFSNNSSL